MNIDNANHKAGEKHKVAIFGSHARGAKYAKAHASMPSYLARQCYTISR